MIWIDEVRDMTDKEFNEMDMGLLGSTGYKSWISLLELGSETWKTAWPQLGPSYALENAL